MDWTDHGKPLHIWGKSTTNSGMDRAILWEDPPKLKAHGVALDQLASTASSFPPPLIPMKQAPKTSAMPLNHAGSALVPQMVSSSGLAVLVVCDDFGAR
jgi:hypothetical protein